MFTPELVKVGPARSAELALINLFHSAQWLGSA